MIAILGHNAGIGVPRVTELPMRSASLSLVLLFTATFTACNSEPARSPRTLVLPPQYNVTFAERLDSFGVALLALAELPPNPDSASAQRAFRRARAAYKRAEYFIEFDNIFWSRALNGPPIPIVDEDDHSNILPPRGLQVVEAVVFPRPAPGFSAVTRQQVKDMQQVLQFIRRGSSERSLSWPAPFEAARMELARIVTLGLAGFDATQSGDATLESAQAMRGILDGLEVYADVMLQRDSLAWKELQRSLLAGIAALEATPDFARFDHFAFLIGFANPIAAGLARMQRSLGLPEPSEIDPWLPGATNVYADRALDPRWFAPDYAPAPTPELVELGRRLFFDPMLSSHGRRSCATCHQPAHAFTDGRRLAAVDPGRGVVRNTPTLLNSGLQRSQFADQRVFFLEFQFEQVMSNPREMAFSPDSAAKRLATDSALVAQFAATLGKPKSNAVTGQTLSIAVAAYVRSLQGLNSRFDRAVRGDPAAITTSERRGFNLFMGKGACGTCHFAPLFGGTMPPAYLESEPEVIGVPATRRTKGAKVDRDPGVFAKTRAPLHRHAFKTPTVRNAALTAPYMHNGVFRTLEQVVDFYDRGGGNGIGMSLPNQTLSAEPLDLTEGEKRDLVAFLEALTDSAYATAAPAADM